MWFVGMSDMCTVKFPQKTSAFKFFSNFFQTGHRDMTFGEPFIMIQQFESFAEDEPVKLEFFKNFLTLGEAN